MRHGRQTLRRIMLAAVAALLLVSPAPARATSFSGTPDRYPWLIDGDVYALARSGDTAYLGGDFHYLGPRLPGLAKLDADGAPDLGFPSVRDGFVRVVEPDGAGGWYVGGSFSEIGGESRTSLAHVLADGRVDPDFVADVTSEGTAGEVLALARSGGRLFVGGTFVRVDGQPRAHLAAVDAATGALVDSWAPDPNGTVTALEASGLTLYVGGGFTTVAGQERTGLAAFDALALSGWAPDVGGSVTALEASAARLYVAGGFTRVGAHLAAFDLATRLLDPSWTPAADGAFENLSYAAATDTLYVSGSPHSVQGHFTYMAGLDGQSGEWVPGAPWTGGYTTARVIGDTVFVAAPFDDDPGTGYDMRYLVEGLDVHDLAHEVFRARMPATLNSSGEARTIAGQGSDVVVGGWFESIGGEARERLAAVDLATGEATDWNPGADAPVRALAISGATVLAGGDFATVGGAARPRLAALDAAGAATAWNPAVAGGGVRAFVLDGATAYVGGSFTSVGGQPRNGAAAVDLSSGTPTAWDPNVTGGRVLALARDGATTLLGGDFATVGGQAHARLAAVDAAGAPLPDWNAQPDSEVRALLVDGGTLFAGGPFLTMGGEPRRFVAALDAATGALRTDWDAGLTDGIAVNALAESGGELFVGGSRTPDSWDADEAIFARVRASDGAEVQRLTAVDSVIHVLAAGRSSVLLGGSFHWIGYRGRHVRGFASFTLAPESSASPTVSGTVAPGETLTCSTGAWRNDPLAYAYAWRRDGAPIAGASAPTYVVEAGDPGRITCVVTARNPGGAGAAESGPAGGGAPPSSTSAPSIAGTVAYEQTIACDPGEWTGDPAFEYQWLRDGDPLDGETAATYRITGADAARELGCRVTAVGDGGRASAFAQAVRPPPRPVNTSAPRLLGTALPGETLTCDPGTWSSTTPLTFTYQWWGSDGVIGTDAEQLVVEADRGDTLSCWVTARNGGGVTAETSNSRVVPLLAPVSIVPPRIVGTPLVGRALKCEPGAWTGASQLQYAWELDGVQRWTIPQDQLVLDAADRGTVVHCTVTAYGADWQSASARSEEVTVGAEPPPPDPGPADPEPTPPPSPAPPRTNLAPPPPRAPSQRADVLTGTAGADVLHGLGGADRLLGGTGADRLFGDAGNDVLVGGPGRDSLDGGAGNDTLDARDRAGGDRVACGPGRDVAKVDRGDRVARDCEKVQRARG